MKRCSISLVLEKCKSKLQWGITPLPVRMAIIQKPTSNKCWIRCGGNGALLHCWGKCKSIQPLWRKVQRFLKTYDPMIPLLGIYPEETIIEKDNSAPMFIVTLFTIAKTWKQSRCPSTDKWIKLQYIYVMQYQS